MEYVHLSAQFILVALGAVMTLFALMGYAEEKAKVHETVARWWAELDERKTHMVSRQKAFTSLLARHTLNFLNRMFPGRLTSPRNVLTAVAFGQGSAIMFAAFILGLIVWVNIHILNPETHHGQSALSAVADILLVGGVLSATVLLNAFHRHGHWLVRGLAVASLSFVSWAIASDYLHTEGTVAERLSESFFLTYLAGLAIATILMLAAVQLTRWMLARIATHGSLWGAAAVSLLIFGAVGYGGMATLGAERGMAVYVLATVSVLFVLSISALAFLSMATLMLAHRVAWPLVVRLTYPIHDYLLDPANRSKLVGIGLSIAVYGYIGDFTLQTLWSHVAGS